MCAVKVRTATVGDDSNSKTPASNDDRTGDEELNGLMSLEPGTGRGPEVTGDQGTQGQKKQEANEAENSVSDNHPVVLGQRP